jgi:selenide,water dikinase
VLVGFDTSDDAGVYQLTPELALVHTVDFFTPIVDDPYTSGQIAAANSLSDVYAMGGRPVSALTLAAFPPQEDLAVMEQILRGGLDKMVEAGCTVVGGHSIRDEDLKFGYAVTGTVHPQQVWRNVGAQPGDVLLLTKPIGTGVIATALKQGKAEDAWVAASAESMRRLNRDAAEALIEVQADCLRRNPAALRREKPWDERSRISISLVAESPGESSAARSVIHAVTDVTGFGLLGHAREMALGAVAGAGSVKPPAQARDTVSLEIDHRAVEYLPGAVQAARSGYFAGGLKNNREFIEGCVEFAAGVPEEMRALLFDPQTSGGLLVAIAPESADAAITALARRTVAARRIGSVQARSGALVRVL